jgi:hypothetical protein
VSSQFLAGVALRVARLTRTPPEKRGPDLGRLPACELAAGFAKVDVFGCRLGQFSREDALTPNDFEMLVVAEKGGNRFTGN